MYLLYADDSGSASDRKQEYFVLGGVAIFERQVHWINLELEKVARRFDPANPHSVELHGSPMLNGRGGWEAFSHSERVQGIKDALTVLANSRKSTAAFCIAVKKSSIPTLDPVEWAFEELCKSFDHFLKSMYRESKLQKDVRNHNRASNEAQRGMMILDESTRETSLQRLTTYFRTVGHSSGVIHNLVEVPLFVDSAATRLVQLADLVAYATFRFVERGDDRFIKVFRHRFHSVSGIEHGLLIKDL
jgi:hypothetical protein